MNFRKETSRFEVLWNIFLDQLNRPLQRDVTRSRILGVICLWFTQQISYMKQQNCLSPCHEFVRMVFLLLTFMLTQQLFSLSTAEETCEKKDVCSCKFKNGSVVNLRPVDGGSKPR